MWCSMDSTSASACCIFSSRAPRRSGRLLVRTIGPVWDGNEVWLLAGGGTLYFAFPLLYASGFSGFYLPLMIVLWLLILRGIGIELRMHLDSPVWRGLFNGCFGIVEPAADGVFRRRAGQRDSRRPAAARWLLLPAAVDGLDGGPAAGHPGLVHGAGRRGGAGCPGAARGQLCRAQDRRRPEPPLPARGGLAAAGARPPYRGQPGGDARHPPQPAGQLSTRAGAVRDPGAGGGIAARACGAWAGGATSAAHFWPRAPIWC